MRGECSIKWAQLAQLAERGVRSPMHTGRARLSRQVPFPNRGGSARSSTFHASQLNRHTLSIFGRQAKVVAFACARGDCREKDHILHIRTTASAHFRHEGRCD